MSAMTRAGLNDLDDGAEFESGKQYLFIGRVYISDDRGIQYRMYTADVYIQHFNEVMVNYFLK